jgi:mono/diheme cytochrome c family protein
MVDMFSDSLKFCRMAASPRIAGGSGRRSVLSLALGLTIAALAGPESALAADLRVAQEVAGQRQELRVFTLAELAALKVASSSERDRGGGEARQWRGPLLGEIIEGAMKELSVEQRAQIDLVVLRGGNGQQALVPRSFLVKYPMLLAMIRDGKPLGDRGPLYSVPPWTSREAKVAREGLPVETFFVPGVKEVILTNFQTRFGTYFLSRRTDPAAMRGQKLFVQSCATCHAAGQGPELSSLLTPAFVSKTRALAAAGAHPTVPGFAKPDKKEGRALNQYLDAHSAEKK